MTTSDKTAQNVDLTFDLVRQALLRPDALEEIAEIGKQGALVYLDPEDEDLTATNKAMADRLEARGETVVRVEVQRRMFLSPVRR
jgi:GTP cyclohydrolase II